MNVIFKKKWIFHNFFISFILCLCNQTSAWINYVFSLYMTAAKWSTENSWKIICHTFLLCEFMKMINFSPYVFFQVPLKVSVSFRAQYGEISACILDLLWKCDVSIFIYCFYKTANQLVFYFSPSKYGEADCVPVHSKCTIPIWNRKLKQQGQNHKTHLVDDNGFPLTI